VVTFRFSAEKLRNVSRAEDSFLALYENEFWPTVTVFHSRKA
jgi:hypothetical protein